MIETSGDAAELLEAQVKSEMNTVPSEACPTADHFRVNLFGALTLRVTCAQETGASGASPAGATSGEQDEKTITLSTLSGARTLLAYLLVFRQQPHSRVVLAGRLWPDVPETRARHSLRHAIWRINWGLPGLLQADSDIVGISPQARLWTDVVEFTDLLKPHLTDLASWSIPKAHHFSRARADLHRAIQLYRGDLLEGFYEDWVLVERDRLREMYLRALERVIQMEKLVEGYKQALVAAQALAGADPLRESAHREIMRLHSLLDRPEAALDQFDTCSQILADELGVQPEIATVQLAREIAGRAGQAAIPHLPVDPQPIGSLDVAHFSTLPLVGRKSERAELVALVDATCKGALGLVLVEGEAGVGKTRLLQEVARDAGWRGAQVLWGKGKELEATSPYGPLLEALNSGLSPLRANQIARLLQDIPGDAEPRQAGESIWLQVLYSLLPALASALPSAKVSRPAPLEPAQEHARLVEALSHLLSAWGWITPLVLILEDLHWADRDTLDTLLHLAEQLPTWCGYGETARLGQSGSDDTLGGVLIVGSYRGEEARAKPGIWERLRELDRRGLHGRLVLSRLDAAVSSELVCRSLGTDQAAPLFEARLYRETDGNPLFVLETLRYLHGEGLLRRDQDGNWCTPFDEITTDYAELPLSPVVEHIIERRLARLSPGLRLVLNVAAVLGNRFDFTTLAAVAGLDAPAALAALTVLIQQGFVEETAREYHFHHDKVRLVAYDDLSIEERVRLHRQAAQTIEKMQPDEVEMLAYHLTCGQVWDRAIHYHQLAAENARAAHAYAIVVEHLDTAIQLLDQPDNQADMEEKRYDLLAAREVALDVLGEREAQAADLEAMLQLAHDDMLRRAHVQCRRAEMLANLSRYDEAEAAAREALALVENRDCGSAQAAALIVLGSTFTRRGQPGQGIPYLRRAVEIFQEEMYLPQIARAHYFLAATLSFYEQRSEAQAEAELSLTLYEGLQDRHGQAQALGALGVTSMEQGEIEASVVYYSQALQIAREIGCRHEEARMLLNLGIAFWMMGRAAQALQHYDESQRIFQALGNRRTEALARMNVASMRHLLLGDDDMAWSDLQAGLSTHIQPEDSSRYEFLGTLGDIARCRGDFKVARAYLESTVAEAPQAGRGTAAIHTYPHLIHLDLDEGDPAMAWEHLQAAETLCQELGLACWAVRLLSLRGPVLLALGQSQAALAATSEAMARLKPGIEQAYLIPFRHSQALSALDRTQETYAALEQAYRMLSKTLSGLPPKEQKMSWERVPEHRALLAAWQATRPPCTIVRLPCASAPTGRPLRDDERVDVHWTVTEPEDEDIQGKVARRRRRLLRLLSEAKEQGAAPTVGDLALALSVSQSTIKRDLAALRQSGHRVNTRGSRTSG